MLKTCSAGGGAFHSEEITGERMEDIEPIVVPLVIPFKKQTPFVGLFFVKKKHLWDHF